MMEKSYNRKQKLFIGIILYLFLFSRFAFIEPVQSQTKNSKTKQETLQYEVTVTLKLIQVYVIDKKGNPVTDLKKSDFELYDNRKPVEITEFEKHILYLAEKKAQEIKSSVSLKTPSRMNRKFFLFFDIAFNDEQGIMRSKKAALHFIDTQLHPKDEVGVFSFSVKKGLTLHEYLTTDHKKVREVVMGFGAREVLGRAEDVIGKYWEEVAETANAAGAGQFAQMARQAIAFDRRIYRRQVSNFSSEIKELARALRYIPGNKHIILFSGGVANFILYGKRLATDAYSLEERYGDASLRTMYEKMSKELAASNSPVYAVNAVGLALSHFKDRDMMGNHSLNQLAKLSGGKYFDNIVNYKKTMGEIQNITSAYYVLGYNINEKWDGKYHKIKVKIKRKGCKIHSQGGYFNPKPFTKYTEFEKLLHLIDLALSEKPHFQEPLHFPLIALPFSIQEESNLLLVTRIPGEKIKEILGRKVEIATLILDNQNNIVEFDRDEVSAAKFAKDNVYYYTTSSLSPGEYDCRVVIRNLETGRGAVASSLVLIPETPDSGLILYPLLLLKPEKNAFYIKGSSVEKKEKGKEALSLLNIHPFDSNQYSPLVEDLNQKNPKLLAVVRYSIIDIKEPEVLFSACLVQPSSGQKIPLSFSILSTKKEEETFILLIEFQTHELQSGKYFLNLIAEEIKSKSKSLITSEIRVR